MRERLVERGHVCWKLRGSRVCLVVQVEHGERRKLAAQSGDQLCPADPRHHAIGDDEITAAFQDKLQGGEGVLQGDHLVSRFGQAARDEMPSCRLIIKYKDAGGRLACPEPQVGRTE